MFPVGTSVVVALGLSAIASLSVTICRTDSSMGPLSFVSEECPTAVVVQSRRIPRFITRDRDIEAIASVVALGGSSRSQQDILSITMGCAGTGDLAATANGPDIDLIATSIPANVYSVFFYGPPIGNPVPFYDGYLCAHWGFLQRTPVTLTSAAGSTEYAGLMQPNAGSDTISVQCMYRDPAGFFGGNLTNGLIVSFEPLP